MKKSKHLKILFYILAWMGLFLSYPSANAQKLAISKKEQVKYCFTNGETISLELKNSNKKTGLISILDDSTIIIQPDTFRLSEVTRIKTRPPKNTGKTVGLLGATGGISLSLVGSHILTRNKGQQNWDQEITGLILYFTGLIIGSISMVVYKINNGKWIEVNGEYSSYELSVI